MAWELEQAADDLRRRQPEAWAVFLDALNLLRLEATERLVAASAVEMQPVQGEVRALAMLQRRLRTATAAVEKLKTLQENR